MSYLEIQGRQVRVSSLDKIFWPKTGTTKGQVLDYYIRVAPRLLPCLQGKPVAMGRYPHGAGRAGFYQKNCPDNAPFWVNTYTIKREGGRETRYVLVDSVSTLVWLVNLGVIEFHPWLSSIGTLDNPDYAVFDLDPMGKFGIEEVCQVALGIETLLSALKLIGRVKTSGATGLQVFVPLEPIYSYKQVRNFVQACCTIINQEFPDWTTLERSISRRQGKIYLDYMQNAREKTIVSAFSLRPQEVPSFSAPLDWEQLAAGKIKPSQQTLHTYAANPNLPDWVEKIPRQRLDEAVRKLNLMV